MPAHPIKFKAPADSCARKQAIKWKMGNLMIEIFKCWLLIRRVAKIDLSLLLEIKA